MQTLSKRKYATTLFLGVVIGYASAWLFFQQEIQIDLNSGEVRTKSALFPFFITSPHSDRAFEVLFPIKPIGEPKWTRVEQKRLVSMLNIGGVTEGYVLVRAENRLVQLMSLTDLSMSDRRAYAAAFMTKLREEGVGAASTYAHAVWEKNALEKSGFDKDLK